MALSTKQVNARLEPFGLTVCKVNSSYFVLADAKRNVKASVYVSSLSHLTLNQWVEEAKAAMTVVTKVNGSVSDFLRTAARSFGAGKAAYKEFLAQAEATGVSRSLARRQFRKVHGAQFVSAS